MRLLSIISAYLVKRRTIADHHPVSEVVFLVHPDTKNRKVRVIYKDGSSETLIEEAENK